MSKSILISGGAGFIGSHLCDFFLNQNFKVIAVDNLLTGCLKNIEHLRNNNNFEFINHDICEDLPISIKIDYILHFASPASPIEYLKHPIETLRVGSTGTENILKIGKKNQSIILVASTSEVYGDPLEHPQKESYFGNVNQIGPRGVYDESKRYLEAISIAYQKKFKLNIKIARIFNTYGSRMKKNDGRVIPTLLNQAINKQSYTLFGDGNQTRSFCFISDTIDGIVKLLFSDFNQPVNIGNPNEYTLLQLTKEINKIVGYENKIVFKNLPEDDPKRRKPDITLAKKILNWEPKVNLAFGLKKTIEYYNKLYNFKK